MSTTIAIVSFFLISNGKSIHYVQKMNATELTRFEKKHRHGLNCPGYKCQQITGVKRLYEELDNK